MTATLSRREWLLSEQPASRRQARLGQSYRTWLALRANPLAMVGLAIVVVLVVVALVAIFSVHWVNGFFMSNNGYEYALALLAACVALLLEGAGKLSLDEVLARACSSR
jgi:hypothetical protein